MGKAVFGIKSVCRQKLLKGLSRPIEQVCSTVKRLRIEAEEVLNLKVGLIMRTSINTE